MSAYSDKPRLTVIIKKIISLWGGNVFKTLWETRYLQLGLIRSKMKRGALLNGDGLHVPIGIAISTTMRCNLTCEDCYSRFHSRENEMPFDTIDSFVSDAVNAGVMLFVITGGEPCLRPEMMDVYKKHRGALFLIVTNGTLVDEHFARDALRLGNIFPVVSIEGTKEETDRRRGEGVYEQVVECMATLKRYGVSFGFSAVLTPSTIETLGSEEFVDSMIERGCVAGFYNEFIPVSPDDRYNVPRDEQKKKFRERIGLMRQKRHIVLIHLPDDEYDGSGRCMALEFGAFHVNAEGYVEPCPFAHYALENIKDSSFYDILRSPFFEAIRKHPTALQRGEIGCALAHNRSVLDEIARETGARPTTQCPFSFR